MFQMITQNQEFSSRRWGVLISCRVEEFGCYVLAPIHDNRWFFIHLCWLKAQVSFFSDRKFSVVVVGILVLYTFLIFTIFCSGTTQPISNKLDIKHLRLSVFMFNSWHKCIDKLMKSPDRTAYSGGSRNFKTAGGGGCTKLLTCSVLWRAFIRNCL